MTIERWRGDYVMQLDLMLADYAAVHQGKLFISGAGINLVTVPPSGDEYRINLGIGLTITIPWQATNQNHRLLISLADSDGAIVPLGQPIPGQAVPPEDVGKIIGNFNVGRAASMEIGEDSILPLAFQFFGLSVPHPGTYTFAVAIDGTEMGTARFRVVGLQPGMPIPGMPMPGQ